MTLKNAALLALIVAVLHQRAADIYADSVMLVERVEDVREQRRLEGKIKQLRESLGHRHAQVASA